MKIKLMPLLIWFIIVQMITPIMPLELQHTVFAADENDIDFGGGNGTPENPYRIYNYFHLNNVRKFLNANFIQMNDIDLSAATDVGGAFYNNGSGWRPIGDNTTPFVGNYDGGGNTIIGKRSSSNGLFKCNSGVIKNLGLVGGNIPGIYAGGIAGTNSGTISNCYNTGTSYAGGIVESNSGTISNCYNTGNVSGSSNVGGGIAGSNSGTISNCYNTGNVYSSSYSSSVGGIVGLNSSTIRNCYTLFELRYNTLGMSLTIDQMKEQASFIGFDFDDIWTFDNTTSYPFPVLKNMTIKFSQHRQCTKNGTPHMI